MDHSEQLNELAVALAKAQQNIKAAVKSSDNPFFKSKFAPLEAVSAACLPALNEQGLSIIQGGDGGDGEAIVLSTMLLHTSGQWVESRISVRPVKSDPQGIGSAISYCRRYGLAAICGMVTIGEDDDGNAASGNKNGKQASDLPPIRKGAPLDEATRAPGTDKKQPYEERLERALGSPNFTDGQRTVFRQKLKRAGTVQECADICADVEKQADPPAEGQLV